MAATGTPVPGSFVLAPALAFATSSPAVGEPVATALPVTPAGPVATAPPVDAPGAPQPSGGGSSSGGGGSGGGAAPTVSYFLLPSGQRIAATAGDAVTLPGGLVGETSLFALDRVPETLALPSGGSVTVTHPTSALVTPPPTQAATVAGSVTPGEAGTSVQFVSATRGAFPASATDATGAFALAVPLEGADTGVVVVRDPSNYPRLGLGVATLAAGQATALGAIALAPPDPTPIDPPTPPAGLTINAAGLYALLGTAAAPMRAEILAVPGARLPRYAPADLPLPLAAGFLAASEDGLTASEIAGPADGLPAFMAPPSLLATTRPVAGQRLSWGAVPGATLYTVRLGRALSPTPSLWEAATTRADIGVPAGLALAGQDLLLEIQAWDAPEITLYSVASLAGRRELRVPAGPPGPTGRRSVALKTF